MTTLDRLIIIVLLAASNASLVILLCRSHAFTWLRTRVDGTWSGKLLSCPLCTSFWTGLFLIVAATLLQTDPVLLLWWPAVVGITAAWYLLMLRAYSG